MAATLGRWAHRTGQGLVWLVLLALTAVLVVAVVVPRLAGATPYTVLTGSMRPDLPPGTLVVVRPVRADRIRVGDVVTYQLRSGAPEVVTHRVVDVGTDARGLPRLRLQGDANQAPDPGWVRAEQVRGEVWYHVPSLGHANSLLTAGERRHAITLMALLLFAYALVMFVQAARESRRVDDETVESGSPSFVGTVLHG